MSMHDDSIRRRDLTQPHFVTSGDAFALVATVAIAVAGLAVCEPLLAVADSDLWADALSSR